MTAYDFDMIALGSGPAGQRAAIQAAKLGKRTAVIEQRAMIGGACINSGTIPSKTLRQAVMHLSGYHERSIYGASYTVKQNITITDLLFRAEHVIKHEIDIARHQLQRNGIEVFPARASFVDPHTVRLANVIGDGGRNITSDKIAIAVGTTTTRDPSVTFDGQRIFTSDDILTLNALPRSLVVIGAGVIGIEYATMFAALGVRVTVVDKRPRLLPFVDAEIIDALVHSMRQNRVTLRLGEEVAGLEIFADPMGERVRVSLKSGKHIVAERALYSIGRGGAVDGLNLAAAGITPEGRGKIKVNRDYQTDVPHIYAVGDVVGFPSLASTSMEQARIATCHAFSTTCASLPDLFPYGIYTIPEISMVGKTEEELTEASIPYEVGKATYREIARGQIIGDESGLLKLIFDRDTKKLLGVTILGEGASELIHIGQAVMAHGGTIDYFIDTVFNYPTLAECYKTAAFDGLNRLR